VKTVTISINWNSEKSIECAEVLKAKLENDGWTQIDSFGGVNNSVLVYADFNQNQQ
jgi:hypothetical protein